MRANPLGSFVAADTVLSCVDARVKLLLLLVLTIGIFACANALCILGWFVFLAAGMRLARVDGASLVRAVRPVIVILLFTLLANALVLDGHGDIALAGPLGISTAGAIRGTCAVLRIVLLAGFACVVSASTTPPEISDACVRLLRPLGAVGVPVADIGLVLSLALRFIPIVAEEYGRIQMAQRSRGVRFDEGSLIERVRVWASVLTPLVVGLFRRADCLAESMASRCYADGASIEIPARGLLRRDWILLIAGIVVTCAMVLISAVAC